MGKKSLVMDYYISKQEEIDFLLDRSDENDSDHEINKAFSKSIRTKKDTTTYNAHSYPTKVPPEGIVPFIDYYTKPGDVVLDPFCGSGMTGLGVRMQSAKTGQEKSVILNDLGTAATHIAFNYNNPVNIELYKKSYETILKNLNKLRNEAYLTYHPLDENTPVEEISLEKIKKSKCKDGIVSVTHKRKKYDFVEAEVVTTIWSEVNECTHCGDEINLWEVAMNPADGKMSKEFDCTTCGTTHTRKSFKKPLRSDISFVIYEYHCPVKNRTIRNQRTAGQFDNDIFNRVKKKRLTTWYPKQEISPKREMMTMGPAKLGVKNVADFYTKRNLLICSKIWNEIDKVKCARVQAALRFACTNTFWHATRMRRFNVKGGMRPLTGTLYIPQISTECNVFKVLSKKVKEQIKYYTENSLDVKKDEQIINTCHINESATELNSIPSGSIDYIFTDPPFGGNIFYSDCNIIWDGWLNSLTNDEKEILFNRSRGVEHGGKTRSDYHTLMDQAFSEMFRVLKPGKWASVVFNNSDNDVLAGFIDSAVKAGFSIEEVTFFDKDQKSVKGYMGQKGIQNVTNLDIVLTVKKKVEKNKTKARNRKVVNDDFIYSTINKYLIELPRKMEKEDGLFTEEHRTTPFLHSMLLRLFIKKNIDLRELTIDRISNVCKDNNLEYKNGYWYLARENQAAA